MEKYHDDEVNPANETIASIRKKVSMRRYHYFFIIHKKTVAGCIALEKTGKSQYKIGPLVVLPAKQGLGVAKAVLKEIELLFSAKRYYLEILLPESKNLHLYESMGYCRTGEELFINEQLTAGILEKKPDKKHFWKSQLHKEKRFLPQLIKPFLFTAIFFILAMVGSAFYFQSNPEATAYFNAIMMEMVENADVVSDDSTDNDENVSTDGETVQDMIDNFSMFRFIFLNNLRVEGIISFSGLIPFLLIPLYYVLINCLIISAVCVNLMQQGVGIGFLLASLLPHGILEIPTLIFGAAIGIHLCLQLSKRVIKETPFLPSLVNGIRTFLMIMVPLILAAAFIESYITPYVVMLFM